MADTEFTDHIGAPARRALSGAGIHTLDDLRATDLDALARLHGIGPKALRILTEARRSMTEEEDGAPNRSTG
ncbi:helix-hairpin-helix domain-containing protein [Agreia sp.]|uniref:helix-hairpin-helix domain-containing protein n=1 Tax=Agreia sp. TaxID=1872416 RepID=UPI0035BC11EE